MQQRLLADDGDGGDRFGSAVALKGDTALIGAKGDEDLNGEDAGSVYAFTRSEGSWRRDQKFAPDAGNEEDAFGTSIAMDRDVAVIGAPGSGARVNDYPGSAYVFTRGGNATPADVVEDFGGDISDAWRGDTSKYEFTAPAFDGSRSAGWQAGGTATTYSLPGDGLPTYAGPGDTVCLAVRMEGAHYIDLGFAKSADATTQDYRARLECGDDEFLLVKRAADGSETTLAGPVDVTVEGDTWYWIEIDYDGGGEGVHPARVYSTDTSENPGSRDRKLAELPSPTKDTDYRGRGHLVEIVEDGRVDYLTVTA